MDDAELKKRLIAPPDPNRVAPTPPAPIAVRVVGFDMSIGDIVALYLKATIALIPFALACILIAMVIAALLRGPRII